GTDAVQRRDGLEQLERRAVDRALLVPGDRRRAADPPDRHQDLPARASPATNSRSASARRSGAAAAIASSAALPTTTPSATPRSARTCSGALMPKPTTIGSRV